MYNNNVTINFLSPQDNAYNLARNLSFHSPIHFIVSSMKIIIAVNWIYVKWNCILTCLYNLFLYILNKRYSFIKANSRSSLTFQIYAKNADIHLNRESTLCHWVLLRLCQKTTHCLNILCISSYNVHNKGKNNGT